jgi:Transposase DDE domain
MERSRRRVETRRAAARGRRRLKRKGARYRPWRRLTRDQHEVARRLTAGQVALVAVSGWGFVASFLAFLDELEFFALLDLEGKGYKRVMIPLARLVLTYQLKVLLGIGAMNLVPAKLFREVALMRLVGYTAAQLRAGFCRRGDLAAGPMHKDTLADAVERLTAEELEGLLNATARRLAAAGAFRESGGHFALDASDLPTTPRYQGAGQKSYTERKVTKDKQVVEVVRWAYGFKVLIVYEVRLRLVVAAKVAPIQEHESRYTLELARRAIANLGPGILRVLLVDRGFLDGADLWALKHELGLDFVIPSKADMRVTEDARALCRLSGPDAGLSRQERAGKRRAGKDGKARWPGRVAAVGVPELRSLDTYGDADHAKRANRKDFVGNPLNAVVVTAWEGKAYPPGEERVFLTTLPVDRPLEALDLYDLRSLIENTAFRELKQGWALTRYPKKTEAAVRGHVFLTLLTFTLANAFRTALGRDLADRGIRRQRAEEESAHVFVLAGDRYAFFHIEEILILLGVTPQTCLHADPAAVRRLYGLPDAA